MQALQVGVRRSLLVAGCVALGLALGGVRETARAASGTPTGPGTTETAWSAPSHDSPFEALASRIASHIAGRAVSVQCELPADWAASAAADGLDPGQENGFVGSTWDQATGQLTSLSTVAELDGVTICAPLSEYAAASSKPTMCVPEAVAATASRAVVHGAARGSRSTLAAVRAGASSRLLEPCYLGRGREARALSSSYWSSYQRTAWAMLTLAHESIHLGGIVGGVLADGAAVGDQQAEAKANCFGMQWVPYVAQQLGDTATDGQAIAEFIWDTMYPELRASTSPAYWSGDCAPGGPFDIRGTGMTAWP